jgi:hypothetical protein
VSPDKLSLKSGDMEEAQYIQAERMRLTLSTMVGVTIMSIEIPQDGYDRVKFAVSEWFRGKWSAMFFCC